MIIFCQNYIVLSLVPMYYTFISLSCKLTSIGTGCSSPFVPYRRAFIGQTTVCKLFHAHRHWAVTMFLELLENSTSIHQTDCFANDQTSSNQTSSLICLLIQMCVYSSYDEHVMFDSKLQLEA